MVTEALKPHVRRHLMDDVALKETIESVPRQSTRALAAGFGCTDLIVEKHLQSI